MLNPSSSFDLIINWISIFFTKYWLSLFKIIDPLNQVYLLILPHFCLLNQKNPHFLSDLLLISLFFSILLQIILIINSKIIDYVHLQLIQTKFDRSNLIHLVKVYLIIFLSCSPYLINSVYLFLISFPSFNLFYPLKLLF